MSQTTAALIRYDSHSYHDDESSTEYAQLRNSAGLKTETHIVRDVSCVLLGSTEDALTGNFTPISHGPAKCAMRIGWVHSGALRAPLCLQGDVMAHFAGRREIGNVCAVSTI